MCFDAVGLAAGRASGLSKTEWWGAGVVIWFIWSFMPLTATLIIISFSSPTLSLIPDLKPFSANPFHCSLSFSSSALTT